MNPLYDQVMQALNNGGISKIASQLGVDEATARQSVENAVPMLLGGAQKQAATPEGAQALFEQALPNDGSILDNVGDHLDSPQADPGIAQAFFGGNQEGAVQALAGKGGLDLSQAGSLIGMLGPVVMGALGKEQSKGGLDLGGLAGMLGGLNLGNAGGLMGMLDKDGDGDIMEDLGGMLGGLMGGNQPK